MTWFRRRPRPRAVTGILLVLALCGGHLALLQIAAWSAMLVERTQTSSFREAMRTTFDGEHRCALCRAIDEAAHAQSAPASVHRGKPTVITHAVVPQLPLWCASSAEEPTTTPAPRMLSGRSIAPETPPPEAL